MKHSTMVKRSKRKTKGTWPKGWRQVCTKAATHRQRQITRDDIQEAELELEGTTSGRWSI